MDAFLIEMIQQYPWLMILVVVFSVVGYAWAMLRQLIPAKSLEKLPAFLVTALEFMAANKGHAENLVLPRPQKRKT